MTSFHLEKNLKNLILHGNDRNVAIPTLSKNEEHKNLIKSIFFEKNKLKKRRILWKNDE